MTQHQWFYSSKGGQAGPVGDGELAKLASTGAIAPADLVWRDGLGDWIPASKVRGLFPDSAAPAARPTPAAAPAASSAPVPAVAVPADVSLVPAADVPTAEPGPANVLAYVGGGSSGPEPGVTPRVVEILAATRPWVLLFSILMFIAAALMGVGGLAVALFGLIASAGPRGGAGVFGAFIGLIYLAMGLFFFVPALSLSRFASRIAKLRATGNAHDLESALDAQRAYWKFVGILTCIVFGIYIAIVVVAIVAGVMS